MEPEGLRLRTFLSSTCTYAKQTLSIVFGCPHSEPDFAIKPGYKCELQAKAWCAPPAVSFGSKPATDGD